MLRKKFNHIRIILASQSPRRKELLSSLDVDFEVVVKPVDESVDVEISAHQAAEHIALRKLEAFSLTAYADALIITSDTVVVDEQQRILGKPKDAQEAVQVLRDLSGQKHLVYTGVAIQYQGQIRSFTCCTEVQFAKLIDEEIYYYVENYKPFDKAGSYGIQEWIGRIGVESITGSFENVMGLPTQKLYQELKAL